ncbi:DUF1206 domain-containing protein [Microbacterium lacus]|uniref:DUF1206 domain-containing protein n=1 Tax=Microbacterium lacus TaxID=415217 RepID=UPI0031D77C87
MDATAPRRVAREVERSAPLRALARGGYAANGLLHILIGAIAVIVAFGGDGASDQSGALMAIAAVPFGFILLWTAAITLGALAVWQLVDGILQRAPADNATGFFSKWGRRIGAWGQAAIFGALGLIAAAVALGARVDAESAAEAASAGLLSIPGGSVVLVLAGIGIGIGGIAFIVMGVRRSFRDKVDIPDEGPGRGIAGLGLIGFVAKGIALGIVGVLLVIAAVDADADTAGGLDGALQALLRLPLGPMLVAIVGAGFIAYGVFCLFRARFARL